MASSDVESHISQNFTTSSQSVEPKQRPAVLHEDKIIGIFGLPGCGKTTLLNALRKELEPQVYEFYEGSEVLASICPGGLNAFQAKSEDEKEHWRERAIDQISADCAKIGKTAIVTGHFSFLTEDDIPRKVWTPRDATHFTHILYYDLPTQIIQHRRNSDVDRHRRPLTDTQVQEWKEFEMMELRQTCLDHGIYFSALRQASCVDQALRLIRDWSIHDEDYNVTQAQKALDSIMAKRVGTETIIFVDADRTLAPHEASAVFCADVDKALPTVDWMKLIKSVFSSQPGYSYKTFRQTILLDEEIAELVDYDETCCRVAKQISMYPEVVKLLRMLEKSKEHLAVVVVTCGIPQIWKLVLEREGFSDQVPVIGSSRISDGYVVTPDIKAALVLYAKERYKVYTWAIGDSPVDIPMMQEADEAIVVVGEEHLRSTTMDTKLATALDSGLTASQILLPTSVLPRLDGTRLPIVRFDDRDVLSRMTKRRGPKLHHATNDVLTQVLMTPSRNADVSGLALQGVHKAIGTHLATKYIFSLLGIEKYQIPHVQGHVTDGFRLRYEEKTTIIAVMRGGEPMARGVFKAIPSAAFVHARTGADLEPTLFKGQRQVILVDSVINTGRTMVEFLQAIKGMKTDLRLVVVAGVVQTEAVGRSSILAAISKEIDFEIVALRLSENKYTGEGATDTGNRLFQTTNLA